MGSTQGFESVLQSIDATGMTAETFILVNRKHAADQIEMYAGITRSELGTHFERYTITVSADAGVDTIPITPGYLVPDASLKEMIRIHAVYIPTTGWYRFEASNGYYTWGDLGFGIYGGESDYILQSQNLPGGYADEYSDSSEESFTVYIDDPGDYVLVVFFGTGGGDTSGYCPYSIYAEKIDVVPTLSNDGIIALIILMLIIGFSIWHRSKNYKF
jgi:hypothetical protein